MIAARPEPMTFAAGGPLTGSVKVPGDKSISHRALMLSAMATGRSTIVGLSEGEDVRSTARALMAMGVNIQELSAGNWQVSGVGTGGLLQPRQVLDMANSGTSTRLLMGLVASHPIQATFIGDASLTARPMDRAIIPLRRIGAEFVTSPGGRLPLAVRGMCPALPRSFRLNVASAQVKSALLLAALNIPGETRIEEPVATRDHSERMLKLFGADITVRGAEITLKGEAELRAQAVEIPADPSSAAFLAVAALIVPGSAIRIQAVCVNPMRIGLFDVLREMGADIKFENEREMSGEPVADIIARHSSLRAVDISPELVPSMIDEFPIFAIAAAFAEGRSSARGLHELRVKESDRLTAMVNGLRAIGVQAEEKDDSLLVHGLGDADAAGGAVIKSQLDHRIAMSFAVAGLRCRSPITVDDMRPVETSFPKFASVVEELRA